MYRSEDFYEDQRSSIGSPASTIAKEEAEFNSTDIAHAHQNNKSNENNGLYVWSKVRILTQYFWMCQNTIHDYTLSLYVL